MSNVDQLDDHRQHFKIVDAANNAHCCPVSLVEDIASGKADVLKLEDPRFLQGIVREWLEQNIPGKG